MKHLTQHINFVTIMFVALFSQLCLAQWEDAQLEPVANSANHELSSSQSLASDPYGDLYAVYERWNGVGPHSLIYSRKIAGGSWQEITVLADSGVTSFQPCLAYSLLPNIPFFAYVEDEHLVVKFEGEVMWFEVQVSPDSQHVFSPTIAVDNLGYIHLAWIFEDGDDNYRIGYAYGNGFDWETDYIEYDLGPFGSGAAPRIVIDGQGAANILFRGGEYPNYRIQHAIRTGDDFTITPIITSNAADYIADVVADESGNLHAAISGNDGFDFPGRVEYVYYDPDFGWTFSITVSNPHSATYGAIALDSEGNPYVIWAELSGNIFTGNLFYSSRTSSVDWFSQLLVGDDFMYPDFVTTPDNFGHAMFTTGSNTGNNDVYSYSSSSPLFVSAGLELDPEIFDFGQVAVGDTGIIAATLTNTGSTTITVSGNTITSNFSTTLSGAFPLNPGAFVSFDVSFHPPAEATYAGWFRIQSDSPTSPDSAALMGIGFDNPNSVDNREAIPTAFRLNQNYPNPFNPTTEISFDLPAESAVHLTVFDVSGREVAVLRNQTMTAGSHSVQWNAASSAAGVYLIELVAGNFRDVRKAVLLK